MVNAEIKKDARIYVAGHTGMVGAALVRCLQQAGYHNLVLKTTAELDLRNQAATEAFFKAEQPEYVLLAAAKVGGIQANNTYRASFLHDNLAIATNAIHAAYEVGVKKLLFLGSSCIYPKLAPQPIPEEALLTGPLEPTNEPYAIAKIAGLKLCEAYHAQYGCQYITVMPTNLYGPGDNYNLANAHVLPALLRKCHEAQQQGAPNLQVWGDGSPLREFLHVDDLAAACLLLLQRYTAAAPLNIGSGEELSIKQLALLIQEVVGYKGQLSFDASKPNGTPRKLLDSSKIKALGFKPSIGLRQGISAVYQQLLARGFEAQRS